MAIRDRISQYLTYLVKQIKCSQGGVLLGRVTGAGVAQEITVGSGLTLSGTTLTAEGTATWSTLSGKPATFAPIIGSGAGDAVAGNDSRLTDARTPTAHTHTFSSLTDKPTSLEGYGITLGAITPTSVTTSNGTISGTSTDNYGVVGVTTSGIAGGRFVSLGSTLGVQGVSTSGTGGQFSSSSGTYHAHFGATSGNDRSAVERVRGWFVWFFGGFVGRLKTADITADRDWTLPDKSGTVVLIEDASASGLAILTGTPAEARNAMGASSSSISVKDSPYLAVGDGIADDTTAIQAALNTGKPVYVPAGTYAITSALKFVMTGQQIFGAGVTLTKITVAATNHNAFQLYHTGVEIRDCMIAEMTILGPGYATTGSGQTGVYWQDPAVNLTQICADNRLRHVHIAGFDRGVYAHQNPGLKMDECMIIACNTACDLSGVDFWTFSNCIFHSWGTMGNAFYNHPGGLLLRIRNAEDGASNPGPGFNGLFISGELTRCARAVWMTTGSMTMTGGNLEGSCSGSLDGGVTKTPIGDETFYLDGSCKLILDNVRMASLTAGAQTPNGTNIFWATRAQVRMIISNSAAVPSLVVRGAWKNESTGWDDVAMVGSNYHNGIAANQTSQRILVSRYPTGVNGALVASRPMVSSWTRTTEYLANVLNTPAALAALDGDVGYITQSAVGQNERLMFNAKKANGEVVRRDMLNAATLNVLATSETLRTNTDGTLTVHKLLDPVPAYSVIQEAANRGERLVIECFGKFANNANSKTISITNNGTSVYTFPATTAANIGWVMRCVIVHPGAGNTAKMAVELKYGANVYTDFGTSFSINWAAGTGVLGVGLTGVATSDIDLNSSRVSFECSDRKY